jgi:hypothetical protein
MSATEGLASSSTPFMWRMAADVAVKFAGYIAEEEFTCEAKCCERVGHVVDA